MAKPEPSQSVSRADHTACQAAHNALYEAAVEIMENPPGIGTQRDYFDHRLGTMGHLLQREGFEDIMRERDRYRAALLRIWIGDTGPAGSVAQFAFQTVHPPEDSDG